MFRKLFLFLLFLFLYPVATFSQVKFDTIPLYGVHDNYAQVMQSVFETHQFKSIENNRSIVKNGKEEKVLTIKDYIIIKVVYAKKFEKRFIAICETSSNFPHVLFLGDEKGNISEYSLGDIIMGFYQKQIDNYQLLLIKEYSRSQTRENFLGYFVLSIDMNTFNSEFVTFIEWEESPAINFGSPKIVVEDTFISFQERNGKFYAIKKSKENCQEITRFEFHQGNFRKVK